jgi:hypothetical protein
VPVSAGQHTRPVLTLSNAPCPACALAGRSDIECLTASMDDQHAAEARDVCRRDGQTWQLTLVRRLVAAIVAGSAIGWIGLFAVAAATR